jgi:D-3-phosphoglycerate dehydrogenase
MKYVLFQQDLGLTHDETRRLLKKVNCDCEPIWNEASDADTVSKDVEILVTANHQVKIAELKKAWPNLIMVSLAFTGFDGVDLAYARSERIQVYYVPGYATASVAELNVALTLSILRKIPLADVTIRKGEWDQQTSPGIELAGKKIGIVGTGTIGIRTAKLFQAFGCSIIGWSRTQRDEFIATGAVYVSEKAVFAESDVVILCLQLNDKTRHFVGRTHLESMKDKAVLINTARSDLVDKFALLQVLSKKRIFAGIDVFDEITEKGSKDDLFEFDNVVLTPHLGFKTKEARDRLANEAIANIGRFLVHSRENLLTKD